MKAWSDFKDRISGRKLLIVLEKRGLVSREVMENLLTELEEECRKIMGLILSFKKA